MTIEHPKLSADPNPLRFINGLFEAAAATTSGEPPAALFMLPLCLLITVVVMVYVFLFLPIYFVLKGLLLLFRSAGRHASATSSPNPTSSRDTPDR